MLGCILLVLELILPVFMPIIGIPLLIVTVLALLLVGALRGALGLGRMVGPKESPPARAAKATDAPAGPPICPGCGQVVWEGKRASDGALYHAPCFERKVRNDATC